MANRPASALASRPEPVAQEAGAVLGAVVVGELVVGELVVGELVELPQLGEHEGITGGANREGRIEGGKRRPRGQGFHLPPLSVGRATTRG
jgi:hypothetical protein